LELEALAAVPTDGQIEVSEGLLHCGEGHWFPVVRGVPRMLPDALREHWSTLAGCLATVDSPAVRELATRMRSADGAGAAYDRRTRENFSLEWDHHDLGDNTWGMDLDDRVRWFFLEPLRIDADDLAGKVVLDAGCGNGSQSVAYTRHGLEVVALDLSSGLEHGQRLRHVLPGARPDRVHFVQGDLMSPPLAPSSMDIVHSAGVIHHTPDTELTFRRLAPLVAPGGTLYVWVYKYEPMVTPVVNTLRAVTTRVPPSLFARVARRSAGAFQLFCRTVNALGIRTYSALDRREAALALMDIFGAPYAHYHSFDEVARWYGSEGFDEIWGCNDGRRGFGVCGRRMGGTTPLQDLATAQAP
jgi:SAM-dependent methyltransferase